MAQELQSQGFTRLSIDEEAWAQGYLSQPLPEGAAREIEGELRVQLVTLIERGFDVVLDYSFWSRSMRDDYRRLVEPLGVIPKTIYVSTPRKIALRGVRNRNGTSPNEVQLSDVVAAEYYEGFEPPTVDEGPLQVVRGVPS